MQRDMKKSDILLICRSYYLQDLQSKGLNTTQIKTSLRSSKFTLDRLTLFSLLNYKYFMSVNLSAQLWGISKRTAQTQLDRFNLHIMPYIEQEAWFEELKLFRQNLIKLRKGDDYGIRSLTVLSDLIGYNEADFICMKTPTECSDEVLLSYLN